MESLVNVRSKSVLQYKFSTASLWLNHTYSGLNQAVPYESAVPLWFIAADLDLKCPSIPLKLSDWLSDGSFRPSPCIWLMKKLLITDAGRWTDRWTWIYLQTMRENKHANSNVGRRRGQTGRADIHAWVFMPQCDQRNHISHWTISICGNNNYYDILYDTSNK